MLKYRERTNTWPGFVDLFSNLVIILIFLLIVFIFLWTTTNVFNSKSGVKKVAELTRVNAEQSEQLRQMQLDEKEAKRLLILARSELENLESNQAEMAEELQQKEMTLDQLVSAYDRRVKQMQQAGVNMELQIQKLTEQLATAQQNKEAADQAAQQQMRQLSEQLSMAQQAASDAANPMSQEQADALQAELQYLNDALAAAKAKAAEQEVQYVEISARLNRALADKAAEAAKYAEVAQFQSEFYKAIKLALGDQPSIQQDGDRFIVSSDILFGLGEFNITTEGRNQLRLIANVIKDLETKIPTHINWIIRIDGHTDKLPVNKNSKYYNNNLELSLLRAQTVAEELEKAGVSRRRLVPSGFGELYPVELGNSPADLQKNRRIELRLTNP